jgi:hypothetical protein
MFQGIDIGYRLHKCDAMAMQYPIPVEVDSQANLPCALNTATRATGQKEGLAKCQTTSER